MNNRRYKKVFLLSYDDGVTQDRRLIELLNKYDIKATLNINSGKLGNEYNVNLKEVKTLYQGHEVASHTVNHPYLTNLSHKDVVDEIRNDQEVLEMLVGYKVHGFAYPFGEYSSETLDVLKSMDIEYGRTVENTHSFIVPNNLLEFHPTCHHNDPEIFDLLKRFSNEESNELQVFTVWGHSWEFGSETEWDRMEEILQIVSEDDEIMSETMIDFVKRLK